MYTKQHISHSKLYQWALKSPENKVYVLLVLGITIIEFIIFKYLYPYPNFLPDSFSYLEAAFYNQNANTWPIGYSKFLRLFSTFTHSDTVLILFQYLILQASILYFLYSLSTFLKLGRWTLRILLIALMLNPLWLYISNFISSDALFTALSLSWFSSLLWIIYQPSLRLFIIHGIILLLAFTIRYNALYYPLISIAVIAFSSETIKSKLIGVSNILVLLCLFIIYTCAAFKSTSGVAQFSAFSGWQLASNALFMYAHVESKDTENIPAKFSDLHTITLRHMDSLQKMPVRPDTKLGIYYLWNDSSPLKQYLNKRSKMDSTSSPFKNWASMSPLYAEYGSWLIKRHPIPYIQHYIWPNMINYYVPDAEFLSMDNMGTDVIDPVAQHWFGYKTNKIRSYSADRRIKVTMGFSILLAGTNILFALGCIGFFVLNGAKEACSLYKRILYCMIITWIVNLVFSVSASPVVLRYQAFPMIITLSFGIIVTEYILRKNASNPATSKAHSYPPNNTTDKYCAI